MTDVLITSETCRRVAEEIPEEVILMRPQPHDYSPHHMDFPWPITMGGPTFVEHMLDITRSLVHHGFRRIFIVNVHVINAQVAGYGR